MNRHAAFEMHEDLNQKNGSPDEYGKCFESMGKGAQFQALPLPNFKRMKKFGMPW